MAFLVLQTTTGGTTSAGTTVYLAPEQMQQLAEQGQGNLAFLIGFLCFALVALGGMYLRSTGA